LTALIIISLTLSLSLFLSPSQPSDWYSITLADLKNIGAPATISKVTLAETLQEKYPDFKWEKLLLFKGRYGQQRRLEHLVADIFPVITYPPTHTQHHSSSLAHSPHIV